MKSVRFALLAGALVLPFAATAQTPKTTSAAAAMPELGNWGVDLRNRDLSVKPGDSFWHYANGTWAKTAQIPADQTTIGGFRDLADRAELQVRAIVTDLQGKPQPAGTAGQQIADMYASFMNEAAIEAKGLDPLKPHLDRINAASTRADLVTLFAQPGYPSPINVGITIDPRNPTRYIASASQGGLGLPNRDYYLREDGKFPAYRSAYRQYLTQMLSLAGIADAAARADRLLALETAIAREHWAQERSRDVSQTFNPMTPAQLQALAPQFEMGRWLTAMKLGGVDTIVVRQPSAIAAQAKLFETVPLETWKDQLVVQLMRNYAPYLPKTVDDATFEFYGRTLNDVEAQRDRWKRAVATVNGALGEAVGQEYVRRHYPPTAQAKMAELIADVRASLGDRIRQNGWMDAETKTQALAKLAAFDPRIGFPTKWVDYSTLRIDRDDALGNALRAADFQYNLQLERFPKPVDRTLWFMTPQTVNAYYSPLTNQITFPAAILQPPFFDPNADAAVNYGGIGAVIGHEIGHGFDDQGRRYAADGSLRDWWTQASAARYQERAEKLGKQYSAVEFLPGVFVNGKLSMGENIGDLSGVETAYGAYQRYQAKHGRAKTIDGLTGDQRFFLGYAQIWKGMRREGAVRQQLLVGPHSPEQLRVNMVVRNVDAWYKAWNVKPGDKLYLAPADRVRIW